MQNTNSHLRSFLSDTVALVKAATHDPQAQLVIENRIHRCVRHCMKALKRLVGIESYTRGIAQQQEKKNVGIWRQLRDPLLHLVEGQVAVVGELNPACEWLDCLLEGLLPKMLEWRRTHYHLDIFCRGCNLQHIFNEAGNLIYLPDIRGAVVQRVRRQ